MFSVDISFLETIAALSRQLGRRDAALDLLLPSNRKPAFRPSPSVDETLHRSTDRGDVIIGTTGFRCVQGKVGTDEKIGGAVMLEEFRGWIHRHFNVVLSFVVGSTFGISILALVYFSTRNDVAARALRYGVQITGGTDIAEDLIWFICGIVVGASVTSLAWWRDSKAQLVGLEKADVLIRLFKDPTSPNVQKPKKSPQ